MKINNIEEISPLQLKREIEQGGKFVIYEYTISILILTFRRSSDIYFIKSNENAVVKGLGFTLLSFFLGWWGIPWGPIYAIGVLYRNLSGGKEVTQEVVQHLVEGIEQQEGVVALILILSPEV